MDMQVKPSEILVVGDSEKFLTAVFNATTPNFTLEGLSGLDFEEFLTWELPLGLKDAVEETAVAIKNAKTNGERNEMVKCNVIGAVVIATLFACWKRLRSYEVVVD